ncbi:lysophospholipid acyltransferase 7-like [Diadema antillarum]|uniref:lysophospholipid acyltransferase 7-like n=1 Tax=Diadema antillarum TaxID=105358 RepID=UPI003A84EF84
MSRDELIYLFMLLLSISLGHVVKHTKGARNKQLLCTGVGLSFVLILCRWQSFHSVFTTLVNAVIIKAVGPRKCHVWSFIFCFSYLAFFRAAGYFGFDPPTSFSNVVQLLLTLKIIGVSFEVHDSHKIKQAASTNSPEGEEKDKKVQRYVPTIEDPSILEHFHYGFCFIGILTGPYFKYKTYYDMLHHPHSASLPSIEPLLNRIKVLIPVGGAFLLFSHYFTVDYMKTDEFYENSYWYRTFYMVPIFVVFRTRMYSAWLLSECVCMSAALGAYPKALKPKCGQGPSIDPQEISGKDIDPSDYDYEAVHNISGYMCDMTTTFRDGMRWWNMSVQWWLKNFIYFRCPVRAWSTSATMLVSAFWHGIHPGYYLSFMTVPMILYAEDLLIRAFRTEQNKTAFDWLNWFLRMRAFDYLACGFLLLSWEAVTRYWASTFFIVHVVTFAFIGIGLAFQPKKKRKTDADSQPVVSSDRPTEDKNK